MLSRQAYQSKVKACFHFFLYLTLFALPFYKVVIPTLLVSSMVFGLLLLFAETAKPARPAFWVLGAMVLFYLLHVAAVFYSDNAKAAWFDLEVKSSFFLLPLCFSLIPVSHFPTRKNLMKAFTAGCLIACGVCIGIAFWRAADTSSGLTFNFAVLDKNDTFWHSISYGGNYLFYDKLAWFHHPTYTSMYCLMCLAFLPSLFRDEKRKDRRIGISLLFIFFSLFVALLSSKAATGCLFLLLAIMLMRWMWRKSRVIAVLSAVTLIAAMLLLAIKINPRFRFAFQEVTEKSQSQVVNKTGNVDQRVMIWKLAVHVIQQNPLGVGNGDVHESLNREYTKFGQSAALESNLNAHNQLLETAMGVGYPGLLLLLTIFVLLFRTAYRNRDFLLFYFSLMILINAQFESVLNQQAGTVFIALFIVLYMKVSATPLPSDKPSVAG